MPLVYGRDQEVADWVGAQYGAPAPPVTAAIGYERGGVLTAGVYFDGMLPNTIFAHVACADRQFPRQLLRALGAFVFRQLGLERLTFIVSADNTKAIKFVKQLGAQMEAIMPRAFGAYDGGMFVLWADAPIVRRLGVAHG